MSGKDIGISIGLVFLAVVIQTSVLGDGRINPFGYSPAVVIVIVLGCARHLEPEPAILLGFTGGLLLDLLGGAPLGLWAIAYTVAVYVALRFRDRLEDGPLVVGFGVVGLTIVAGSLFLVVGTLFGERFATNVEVIKTLTIPAFYNLFVAGLLFPLTTRLIGDRRRFGWPA